MTDVKELADRPALDASEIEVTPEMIEAVSDIISENAIYIENGSDEFVKRLSKDIVFAVLTRIE